MGDIIGIILAAKSRPGLRSAEDKLRSNSRYTTRSCVMMLGLGLLIFNVIDIAIVVLFIVGVLFGLLV